LEEVEQCADLEAVLELVAHFDGRVDGVSFLRPVRVRLT
jgi:hypothetical protein